MSLSPEGSERRDRGQALERELQEGGRVTAVKAATSAESRPDDRNTPTLEFVHWNGMDYCGSFLLFRGVCRMSMKHTTWRE